MRDITRRNFLAGTAKVFSLLLVGGGMAVAAPTKRVSAFDAGADSWRCRIPVRKTDREIQFSHLTLRYSVDGGPWIDCSEARVVLPDRSLARISTTFKCEFT